MSALWYRLQRFSFTKEKISQKNLRRLTRENASQKPTLIVHPEAGLSDFPHRFIVSKRREDAPDLLVDSQYHGLSAIESESYSLIVCMGLLEHIAEPQRLVDELHRILKEDGKVIISCSACFSFHESPEDYFHYTPYGLRLLFEKWDHFEVLRGSCGPFETIGILLQRIMIQCDVVPFLRPLVEVAYHLVRHLDRFVIRQYGQSETREPQYLIDSMMPSNLQAVIVK